MDVPLRLLSVYWMLVLGQSLRLPAPLSAFWVRPSTRSLSSTKHRHEYSTTVLRGGTNFNGEENVPLVNKSDEGCYQGDDVDHLFPVEDAILLQQGTMGSFFAAALHHGDVRRGENLRHGEDPLQYERILTQLEAPRSLALFLYRFKIWWMRPKWGKVVPPQTIMLLDRCSYRSPDDNQQADESDMYRLVLAVPLPPREQGETHCDASSPGAASSSLRSSTTPHSTELVLCSNSERTGLYVGKGPDPYSLIKEAVGFAAGVWISTSTALEEKAPIPKHKSFLCQNLGWCSWNAFYTNVTGDKVLQAATMLQQKHGVPFRWMILDDGWQDTPLNVTKDGEQWSHRLLSVKEHAVKFQNLSLKDTIKSLKNTHCMEKVLVWHTLAGYWMGLDPTAFQAELQFPKFPRGIVENDWSASKEPSVAKGIGVPIDPHRFIQEYHSGVA